MPAPELEPRLDTLRAMDVVPGALLDAFKKSLQNDPDEALFRMSPLRWAAQHGVDEQQAIDLFLHATHAGILEFAWGVLCPGCMAFMTTPGALRSVQRRHCNFCNIDVERSLDDRVEVAFTVAPTVRRIRFHSPEALDLRKDGMRLFFSSSLASESSPHRAIAEHILWADRALPGAVQTITVSLEQGTSVLLAPASHAVLFLQADKAATGPDTVSVELFDGRALPAAVKVPVGPLRIDILNRMAEPAGYLVACIEHAKWSAVAKPGEPLNHPCLPYLTGPRLIASQAFRDLFRAESIPSEGGLELKGATVLFTDLKGSTAIYERVGDIRAYDLVRRHFAALRAIAAAEGGAIVKTIGDAVMASFADPVAAMRAAMRMNQAIERLGEGELTLKIGLHTGPCIAVELNDRLDYFGRTVNIAARVQGIAGPGEIVCTEAVHGTPGVRELTAEAGLVAERSTVPLRGIAGDVAVVCLRPRG
jgi:class 3 adenylate cyclase